MLLQEAFNPIRGMEEATVLSVVLHARILEESLSEMADGRTPTNVEESVVYTLSGYDDRQNVWPPVESLLWDNTTDKQSTESNAFGQGE